MDIESKVFGRKRFVAEAMPGSGFTRTDGGYRLETGFMNGDFSAVLLVGDNGAVKGTVVDNMNGEEYLPLRFEGVQGAYVNSVRAAYEELLAGIADKCCRDVLFASDQANRVTELIAARYGVRPDCPWEQSEDQYYGVFRHGDNLKWFALIMNVKRRVLEHNGDERGVDIVNLKAEPAAVEVLTERPGIYPAYHMNHKNWISVVLDGSLTDDEVLALIDDSFGLTARRPGKSRHAAGVPEGSGQHDRGPAATTKAQRGSAKMTEKITETTTETTTETATAETSTETAATKTAVFTIRPETAADHREVENLIRESFWNVYRPGCSEHYVIHVLRGDSAFVQELDFVMERDGRLIGQNMFMRTVINADDGSVVPVLTMGPICIAPELKRRGYGKQLLDYSLAEAAKLGYGAVLFEGNIGFYGKSGFDYARKFGIRYHDLPEGADDSFFLCKELRAGYLDGITGVYQTPQGYYVKDEDVEAFDAAFPPKEKLRLPGQLF